MSINYYGQAGDWSPLPHYTDVVWTNGCYDVLHLGHLELLSKCREYSNSLQNCLVFVGLDSDFRVKTNKGKDRPINDEISRISMLLSLKYVDGVFVYDTDEELANIISDLNPSKMVIGEEYKNKNIIGKEFTKELIFFPKIKNFSTSDIISKIKNQ
jgi:D-beta-D-heptose 7-phosphate kinase/D-beta-D-heptose 1-phosphate adenosyltransferase